MIIGVIYYAFEFRDVANRRYFDQVSENIRKGLLQEAGVADDPELYTWQRLRGIFYGLVDGDESLKTKAKLAYFNGLWWTTVADVRALSGMFFLFSLGVATTVFVAFGQWRPFLSPAFFAALYLISFPLSALLTNRHKRIGSEQIEIIGHKYRGALQGQLNTIRNGG